MSAEPASAWPDDVLAHYDPALWSGARWYVTDCSGSTLPFEVHRWTATPDAADRTLLDRCPGPTLDIGCGPGRFVHALAARGVPVLGVDVAAAAVAITRAGGGLALRRSVFDPLPGAGRWRTALLADGNIGIGGDAGALLTRLRELLAPGGHALVEVEAIDEAVTLTAAVADRFGIVRASFPWVRIGARPLQRLAEACGFAAVEQWAMDGRHFVALQRA